MRKYRQLTFEDRIYIEVMRWEDVLQKDIAKSLGAHPAKISRELRRGLLAPDGDTCGYYRGHLWLMGEPGRLKRHPGIVRVDINRTEELCYHTSPR